MNQDSVKDFIETLKKITDVQRVHIMNLIKGHFCEHCGREHFKKPACQCWNDE